jgi:hypothetical protein
VSLNVKNCQHICQLSAIIPNGSSCPDIKPKKLLKRLIMSQHRSPARGSPPRRKKSVRQLVFPCQHGDLSLTQRRLQKRTVDSEGYIVASRGNLIDGDRCNLNH